jgi:hypothetical protein
MGKLIDPVHGLWTTTGSSVHHGPSGGVDKRPPERGSYDSSMLTSDHQGGGGGGGELISRLTKAWVAARRRVDGGDVEAMVELGGVALELREEGSVGCGGGW